MKMETEHDLTVKLMSDVIQDRQTTIVIRRLQDDQAFVIYNQVKDESSGNPYYYYILIDIITQKMNPKYFDAIKKLTRLYNDLSKKKNLDTHFLRYLFCPIDTKDDDGNAIENLIKFNYNMLAGIKVMAVDSYITEDDAFNLIEMVYKYSEFIKNNAKIHHLNTEFDSFYTRFRFSMITMDEYASNDEVLAKAITEDLYGYQITTRLNTKKDYSGYISRKSGDHMLIKHTCTTCGKDIKIPNNLVLYYKTLPIFYLYDMKTKNDEANKSPHYVYLKGEYTHYRLDFKESRDALIKTKYIIPIIWFSFEEVNFTKAELTHARCDKCGELLNVND